MKRSNAETLIVVATPIFVFATIIGWRDPVARVGAGSALGIAAVLCVGFAGWLKEKWAEATAANAAKKAHDPQATKRRVLTHVPQASEEIEIGERVFYAAPLTAKTVERVIDAQWDPSQQMLAGETTFLSKDDQKRATQSMYAQLACLLNDQEGQEPSIEFLSLYLPVDSAQELLTELHPSLKTLARNTTQ